MATSFDRARRMTRSVPQGQEVLEYLQSPGARELLSQAAERGVPPVTAVSAKLLQLLGPAPFKKTLTKQFCGLVVRALLEEEGYTVAKTGVRVRNDPIFVSGAVYTQVPTAPTEERGLLERLMSSLTPEEMRWASSFLLSRSRDSENQKTVRPAGTRRPKPRSKS
jgi:hypothetical protein